MTKIIGLFFLLLFTNIPLAKAYELVMIQAISTEKRTFITRTTQDTKTFVGKKTTFTSDNVTFIAVAKTVSREFTLWEIENDLTDVPFESGDLVTMYDTTEYLWTLTPEKIKRKYIKSKLYSPRRSLEGQLSFSRGLSESVTETESQNVDRGGIIFEMQFKREFNLNWSFSYGIRYDQENVNIANATLVNKRFMGIIEGRYHFEPFSDFYNSQLGISLGFGYGQSQTESSSLTTSGVSVLLPSTKILLDFPLNKDYDFGLHAAFESIRLEEQTADDANQTTNLISTKIGIGFRRHL